MIKYHTFSIIWALFIFFTALLPGSTLPDFLFFGFLPIDKLVHFVEYAGLTFLLIVGFKKQFGNRRPRFNLYRLSVLLAFGFSFLLESGQLMVPGRNFEIWDIVANMAGIFFGRIFFFFVYSFNPR